MYKKTRLLRHQRRVSRGRILAVKWGLNPNSSSLGVDVTFLLLGATALSLVTPVVSVLVQLRRTETQPQDAPRRARVDTKTPGQ